MDESLIASLEKEMARAGARLRALRKRRGWRLEDLAGRTGLSASYLSRIESGEREPSVTALFALARACETSLSALFEAEAQEGVVVRSEEAAVRRGNGLLYASLSPAGRASRMRPVRVIVPSGRGGEELYEHEGEEWLYVLSGTLRLQFGEREYVLESGDSAHFDASRPHRLGALGDEDAEVILVAAAVPRPLLRSYL